MKYWLHDNWAHKQMRLLLIENMTGGSLHHEVTQPYVTSPIRKPVQAFINFTVKSCQLYFFMHNGIGRPRSHVLRKNAINELSNWYIYTLCVDVG